ncbi:MAG: GNAT family N-acetyltransferase [Caldilineaceae bacterium]|nr:GNAT family N-acetyltransferase [Caldilineaceae bacterium]
MGRMIQEGQLVTGEYFFAPMTETHAREIAAWRYPGQYAVYNTVDADVEADVQVLLDPRYAYYAVADSAGFLVGFCCYGSDAQVPGGDYSDAAALDVGLGLRPDLAGQGRGLGFLEAILDFARRHLAATYFRATIAVFNLRSRRVFEKAGFVETQHFVSASARPLEFIVMVKREAAPASPAA